VATEIRVIYGDTDKMGVVYYANYLRFFEASRAGWVRERGFPYARLEEQGYYLPVIEAHVQYRKPAYYDDLIRIEPRLSQVHRVSCRFDYTVTRGGDLLAEGWTMHACINKDGRPVRFPEEFRRLLSGGGPDPASPVGGGRGSRGPLIEER
jgi:acyl-CoA thioester hydrolase